MLEIEFMEQAACPQWYQGIMRRAGPPNMAFLPQGNISEIL